MDDQEKKTGQNGQEQQPAPSKQDIRKQNSRDVVNTVGKEVGKKALEAYGVPPGVSDLAVNKVADNPLVKKSLNKIADNPAVSKTADKLKPAVDAAKPILNAKGGSIGGVTGGASASKIAGSAGSAPSPAPSSTSGAGGSAGGLGGGIRGGLGKSMGIGGGGGSDDGSESSGTAEDVAQTAMKVKKYWPIISAIAPVVGWIALAILAIILVMIPIMYIQDKIENLAVGLDKFINFITLNGWEESDQVFFKNLQNEYNRYDAFPRKQGEFDIPLIASTIHYSTLVTPDSYSYNEADKDTAYEYDKSDPMIPGNQLRNFYIVANDKLGSAFTLIPGEKKLIGHLIDTKFTTKCVNVPQGWAALNPAEWGDVYATAKEIVETLYLHFKYTAQDTGKTYLTKMNLLKLIQLIYAYHDQGQNYFTDNLSGLGYEITHDNFFSDLIRIIKQSDLVNTCSEGQVPMPMITKFINYDYYKQYLREEYLPKQSFATCSDCEFKSAANDRKEALLDKWINEIFDQKDAYYYLQGERNKNQLTEYLPGMSTLPIQMGAGEDWKSHVSRGYQLGTAKCFSNGVWTGQSNCNHLGIDFAYPTGTPVLAVANGYVLEAAYNGGGYGLYVKIGHDTDGDGHYDYYSLYGHLSVLSVLPNSMVGGGQKIGEVGSTGNSTGPHLHFEIMDEKGNKIDPTPILDGVVSGVGNPLNPLSGSMTCGMYSASELQVRNDTLAQRVNTAGRGTRAGVVAAARYLSSEIGIIIPYWYGGKYDKVGINSEWGCPKKIWADPGTDMQPTGTTHPYGLDCSGFVGWSIANGGYKPSTIRAGSDAQGGFTDDKITWGPESINYAQPGDLAWNSHHIGVIIGVDKANCTFYVAEEKGAQWGLIVSKKDCTNRSFTHIVLMDDYYNNSNNKEG